MTQEDQHLNLFKVKANALSLELKLLEKVIATSPMPTCIMECEKWTCLIANASFNKSLGRLDAMVEMETEQGKPIREFLIQEASTCHCTVSFKEKGTFDLKISSISGMPSYRIIYFQEKETLLHLNREVNGYKGRAEALKIMLEEKEYALQECTRLISDGEHLVQNIKERHQRNIILPLLNKLKQLNNQPSLNYLYDLLEEATLENDGTPTQRVTKYPMGFTQKEINICEWIRQGLTSQKMADMMEVTLPTVEFHRKNIRKKLNIGKLRLDQALRQYWEKAHDK